MYIFKFYTRAHVYIFKVYTHARGNVLHDVINVVKY